MEYFFSRYQCDFRLQYKIFPFIRVWKMEISSWQRKIFWCTFDISIKIFDCISPKLWFAELHVSKEKYSHIFAFEDWTTSVSLKNRIKKKKLKSSLSLIFLSISLTAFTTSFYHIANVDVRLIKFNEKIRVYVYACNIH